MTSMRIVVEGETYLSIEAVSECYGCGAAWLHEAREVGVLTAWREERGRLYLHVGELDRVAEAWRLSRYEGRAFETIVVLLAAGTRGGRP